MFHFWAIFRLLTFTHNMTISSARIVATCKQQIDCCASYLISRSKFHLLVETKIHCIDLSHPSKEWLKLYQRLSLCRFVANQTDETYLASWCYIICVKTLRIHRVAQTFWRSYPISFNFDFGPHPCNNLSSGHVDHRDGTSVVECSISILSFKVVFRILKT